MCAEIVWDMQMVPWLSFGVPGVMPSKVLAAPTFACMQDLKTL